MSRPRKDARRGRPPKQGDGAEALTRGRIVDAAIAMIDEAGLEGLSMRAVAGRLGVTPMALYNHVGSHRDLLAAAAEAMLDGARFDAGQADWREAVARCFREMRRVCLDHPGLASLLQSGNAVPDAAFEPMRVTRFALGRAGLSDADATRAYFALVAFTLGQAAYQTGGHGRASTLALEGEWDFDRAFAFGLDAFLDGIERALRQHAA